MENLLAAMRALVLVEQGDLREIIEGRVVPRAEPRRTVVSTGFTRSHRRRLVDADRFEDFVEKHVPGIRLRASL